MLDLTLNEFDFEELACSIYDDIAFSFDELRLRLSRELLLRDIPVRVFFTLVDAGLISPPSPLSRKGCVKLSLRFQSQWVPRKFYEAFMQALARSTNCWLSEAKKDQKRLNQSRRSAVRSRAVYSASTPERTPSEIIQNWLMENGQTYEGLAELCGLRASTVWKLAHGSSGRISSFQAIATAIGLEHWGLLISRRQVS